MVSSNVPWKLFVKKLMECVIVPSNTVASESMVVYVTFLTVESDSGRKFSVVER